MPYEYCFRYQGEDEEFGHTLIEDKGVFLADFLSGNKEIIAIDRFFDNNGDEKARIRTFPAVGVFEQETSDLIVDEDDLPEPEEDFEITDDEELEIDVRNGKDEDLVLVVHHAEPAELTWTGQIPETLIWPN